MFHELLFTLNGYAGDVFQLNPKTNTFQIRTDLKFPLLHPSELVVLNDVLEIASLYKIIDEFLEEQNTISLSSKSPETNDPTIFTSGVYVRAICNGIRDIMKNYTEVISELEIKILNDPYITLSHIRVEVEPFRALFRVLSELISTIKLQGRSTCNLVEVLKAEYDSNIPLHDQLDVIIPWIQRTFFKHITNWVVFGNLNDPTHEFFVQPSRVDLDNVTSPGTPVLKAKQKASKLKDTKHHVNYSIVPSHFSVPLVERILFLGDSVNILKKSEKTKAGLAKKQKIFYEKMINLNVNTFRTEELADIIEELAFSIGKELHHLVVTETDLPKHLGIVKDFYLGGRGELFHDFLISLMQSVNREIIDESDDEMKKIGAKAVHKICSTRAHLDMKGAFALAASRVQVQEDILQRVEILGPTNISTDTPNALQKCIGEVGLNMEQEWPLHILFTDETMEKYNELFRFLLQIRLLQLQLLNVWMETKSIFRFMIVNGPCQLLNNMSYFVNNLQYYLQADVLETQFASLMAAIERSDSFEQIRIAHINFQSNIWAQSFRTIPSVLGEIQKLIVFCTEFCEHMLEQVQACKEEGILVCESDQDPKINRLFKDFKHQIDIILSRLKGLAGTSLVGPYLGQLLLRLDYNSFFSKANSLIL